MLGDCSFGFQFPVASYRSPVAVSSCQFPNRELETGNRELVTANCEPPTAYCQLLLRHVVAQVAVLADDPSIRRLVLIVVATEAAWRVGVPQVVLVGPPGHVHRRKHV